MKRWSMIIAWTIGAVILSRSGPAQQAERSRQGGPPNPLLQAFDADRDGTLSAAEIDAAAAKLRERDANKDGKMTADEELRRPRGGGAARGGGAGRRGGGGGSRRARPRGPPPPPKGLRREADPRRPRT